MSEPTVVTLGCRLNAHEGETVTALSRAAGIPDAVIVNTCAVTTEAVRQAAQAIRKLRRERPQARLIVTGCAAELESARFAAMADVDAVIGNAEKLDPAIFAEIARANGQVVRVGRVAGETRVAARDDSPAAVPRTRAILAVQNGCDHRCTFCIIPFARGPARSMPTGEAVRRVAALVAAGHREVVLTGVDLASYGAEQGGRSRLGGLARAILDGVPELDRLRLSTLDPADVDQELLDVLASQPRLMPHLHLSLQAGDDMVLKRMRRRHTRGDAIRLTEQIRALRPDVVFGADLIAGFPTESDAMFATTLETIEACRLTFLHIFPYSPRPGTPAARMPQVAGQIVVARAARLRQEGRERLAAYLDGEVGAVRPILMERGGTGRTPQFAEVRVRPPAGGTDADIPAAGVMTRVRILGHDGDTLWGEPVTNEPDVSVAAGPKAGIEVTA
jgi:threonylcarbamoyladenosine tRNA methylthiotransferase MtaB